MKKLCFYHKADLDGKCSAAIVKYFDPNFELIPFDYDFKFPWDQIDKNTIVYMVDVSISVDEMYKLINTSRKFVYIDHHISKLKDLDLSLFEGSQKDGTAACILTWKYLSENPVPKGVELLGRYDVWDNDDEVLDYQFGINALNLNPNDIKKWIKYVFYDDQINNTIKNGSIIRKYVSVVNKKEINNFSFKMNWKGYDVIALNKTSGNSLIFESHKDYLTADILMVFGWTGKIWKISLYTNKKNVDVSQIAKKYGGGGHKSAAGFHCNKLPFELKVID